MRFTWRVMYSPLTPAFMSVQDTLRRRLACFDGRCQSRSCHPDACCTAVEAWPAAGSSHSTPWTLREEASCADAVIFPCLAGQGHKAFIHAVTDILTCFLDVRRKGAVIRMVCAIHSGSHCSVDVPIAVNVGASKRSAAGFPICASITNPVSLPVSIIAE